MNFSLLGFLKVATTLVDLLFIELMLHLSHVKQISQSIHLTHELIMCIQITRGKVHFNRDSTVKSPCWHQVLSLWPSDPDLLWYAAIPSLQDLAIFMAPHGWAPFKKPVLRGTALQQAERNTVQTFPRACKPWKSLPSICLAYMFPQRSPALVFVRSAWSSQVVSHPSTIQAKFCLTSVFDWELVVTTWHGRFLKFKLLNKLFKKK